MYLFDNDFCGNYNEQSVFFSSFSIWCSWLVICVDKIHLNFTYMTVLVHG